LNDGNLQYVGGGGTKDAKGGWHDAGDYNKYVVNSGVSVGLMLKAWEHFGDNLKNIGLIAVQNEGNIPAYLAEVKWNLDWVAKMQFDDGKVSHKLSTTGFCGDIMPEEETDTRYFVSWGTEATAVFVAMLAQASRVYAPYDASLATKWLNQAKKSYDVLAANQSFVSPNQSAFSTGEYTSTSNPKSDVSYRLWAAVEMWEATGESKYLNDFESRATANFGTHLGWGDVSALASLTYLSSTKDGKNQTRVTSIRSALTNAANTIVTNTTNHGYGRAFGSDSYYWGNHGALTANAYILNTAYRVTNDAKYRDAGHEIIGHILGRNYFGRSFVTGLGHNPPVHAHDRRSTASGNPWPGYLVGGPHSDVLVDDKKHPVAPPGATCATPAVCYFDYKDDYARNEIAINWNTSMIYALSGYVSSSGNPSGVLSERGAKTAWGAAPKVKTTRLIQMKNGKSASVIPPGAKIYGLDGRLVAHRKAGDAKAPVISRNGVFIMRAETK
jgi:endoglucanase